MPAPTGPSSVLRRGLLLAAIALLPVAAAAQQPEPDSPQAFLKAIYEPYQTEAFKGQPYWEAARFFAPDLAQAIERDFQEAKKRKEVPTLDGDPFIDAQDWRISGLAYASSISADKTKAAGAVAFLNLGEPKGVAL